MLADIKSLNIDMAIMDGFPEQWAESKYDEWYLLEEEISFVDYLYRLEAQRTKEPWTL